MALPKILEYYMGEAAWHPNPPEVEWHGLHGHWPNIGAKLHSSVWVVIVLFQKRNEQLQIRLSWMEVHI